MNPYEILDLPSNATDEEIKSKFKSLAQIHHPDKGGDEDTFKKIKEAYELLIDPIRRKKYDSTGQTGPNRNANDEALQELSNLFFRCVGQINIDRDDLILKMKIEARSMQQSNERDIGICTKYINDCQKLIKKIKRKRDGENMLKHFAEQQLNQRYREMENFVHRDLVCKKMLEMIDDYEFGDKIMALQNMAPPPGIEPGTN